MGFVATFQARQHQESWLAYFFTKKRIKTDYCTAKIPDANRMYVLPNELFQAAGLGGAFAQAVTNGRVCQQYVRDR
jgi:hypothetical protein